MLFELRSPKHAVHATACLENGEFVVQACSSCRGAWSLGSASNNYAKLFAELVNIGVVVIHEGRGRFTANYAFKSPSAAAAVVNGRPANGTTEWKIVGSGKTYKEWEEDQLARDSAGLQSLGE